MIKNIVHENFQKNKILQLVTEFKQIVSYGKLPIVYSKRAKH